jgi:hypothetical protein
VRGKPDSTGKILTNIRETGITVHKGVFILYCRMGEAIIIAEYMTVNDNSMRVLA